MSERGVSTTLGYILTLAITAILVSGLLVAGGNLIEDQRERSIETELEVIGDQLTSQIQAVDRLNQSGQGETEFARIRQDFPSHVTGQAYRITLEESDDPVLRLETTRPDIAVEIGLTNTTAVGQSRISGGDVVVEYDSDEDEVVIYDG